MTQERLDMRVLKTKRSLSTAMFTLLGRDSFSKITVNDLCTEAMVSRSAFYSHFEDKYDLMQFCLQELRQRLFDENKGRSLKERLRCILEKIQANVTIFRNFTLTHQDNEAHEILHRFFYDEFIYSLVEENQYAEPLAGPPEVISVYYASALSSTIIYWVAKDMPYSVNELASCLSALLPETLIKEL